MRLYRIEDETSEATYFSLIDDDYRGNVVFTTTLMVNVYPIVKETPAGYWIGSYWRHRMGEAFDEGDLRYFGCKRWVKAGAFRQFASADMAEAIEKFIARKRCQVRILKGQLAGAEEAWRQGEALMAVETRKPE